MTQEEKYLIKHWFDHIAQMADDCKTLTGYVMDDAHCLDEIKVLAKDSSNFIERFWDDKNAWCAVQTLTDGVENNKPLDEIGKDLASRKYYEL